MTDSIPILPIADTFDTVRAWLKGSNIARPPKSSADLLAEKFGLDDFERNIILLAAFTELESDAAGLVSEAQGDPLATNVSVGLALSALPGAHWRAFSPGSLLRRYRLITVSGRAGFSGQAVDLAEVVLFFLLGAESVSPELADSIEPIESRALMSPARNQLCEQIVVRCNTSLGKSLQLCGVDANGKADALCEAVARHGQLVFRMNASVLPNMANDIVILARLLERDLRLLDGWLLVVVSEASEEQATRLLAETIAAPLALSVSEPLLITKRPFIRLDMQRMTTAQQAGIWEQELGEELSGKLNGTIPRLANAFNITPELTRAVSSDVGARLAENEVASDLATIAWDACRNAARPRMNELAERVISNVSWDDLVLPDRQKSTLRDLVSQVRYRSKVYEEWGFDARLQGRGLGISALFCGPSGSGKTMAGEAIASELGLDVYRVDLSTMVSKWVGETEKNLGRVFEAAEEGGIVLQFDESDALFGKRSEVKDSHDRHANIGVSYLLQRLETYRGLAVLTTNLRENVDKAFLRRMRFIMDFRFPARPEREKIWRRIFPENTPVREIDFGMLGQLNVSGGTIRNIALSAAFLAAEAGEAVNMNHIQRCVQVEYHKTGRIMTDAEAQGWRG